MRLVTRLSADNFYIPVTNWNSHEGHTRILFSAGAAKECYWANGQTRYKYN